MWFADGVADDNDDDNGINHSNHSIYGQQFYAKTKAEFDYMWCHNILIKTNVHCHHHHDLKAPSTTTLNLIVRNNKKYIFKGLIQFIYHLYTYHNYIFWWYSYILNISIAKSTFIMPTAKKIVSFVIICCHNHNNGVFVSSFFSLLSLFFVHTFVLY